MGTVLYLPKLLLFLIIAMVIYSWLNLESYGTDIQTGFYATENEFEENGTEEENDEQKELLLNPNAAEFVPAPIKRLWSSVPCVHPSQLEPIAENVVINSAPNYLSLCNNVIANSYSDTQSVNEQGSRKLPLTNNHSKSINQKKAKNKSKTVRILTNQFSKAHGKYATYDPAPRSRAQGNIQISKDFRASIPGLIEEDISDIYSYIDKCTALQKWNEFCDGNIIIFAYDFHSKQEGNPLYCVARKQDENARDRGYALKMENTLFTAKTITREYKIQSEELPIKICPIVNEAHISEIQKMLTTPRFISTVKWNKKPVYSQNPKRRKYRVTLSLTLEQFRSMLFSKPNKKIVPILMFRNDDFCVQYVWIAKVLGFDHQIFSLFRTTVAPFLRNHIIETILSYAKESTDVGISFVYSSILKRMTPVGIHLDKQSLLNSHQLLYPKNSMNDLDDFDSVYTDLQIGDVDYEENIIKELRRKITELETTIQRMENSDSPSSPSYTQQLIFSSSD